MLNFINESLIFYSSQLLILVQRTTEIALICACFPKARVLVAAVQTGFIFKWMGKHVNKVSHSHTHSVSLLVFSAPLCRVVVIANYSLAISKEIRIWESGRFLLWNPKSWVLESRIQLKESGIPDSKFPRQGFKNPVPGIRNSQCGIHVANSQSDFSITVFSSLYYTIAD